MMITRLCSLVVALVLGVGCVTSYARESEAARFHRVKVIVVARDSALRTTITNRDAYLLRVQTPGGQAFEAVGIDAYPSYEDGLPSTYLSKDIALSVRLKRSPYCDRISPDSSGSIRCFEVDHGSWRKPGGLRSEDAWWR